MFDSKRLHRWQFTLKMWNSSILSRGPLLGSFIARNYQVEITKNIFRSYLSKFGYLRFQSLTTLPYANQWTPHFVVYTSLFFVLRGIQDPANDVEKFTPFFNIFIHPIRTPLSGRDAHRQNESRLELRELPHVALQALFALIDVVCESQWQHCHSPCQVIYR